MALGISMSQLVHFEWPNASEPHVKSSPKKVVVLVVGQSIQRQTSSWVGAGVTGAGVTTAGVGEGVGNVTGISMIGASSTGSEVGSAVGSAVVG